MKEEYKNLSELVFEESVNIVNLNYDYTSKAIALVALAILTLNKPKEEVRWERDKSPLTIKRYETKRNKI